MIIVPGPAMSRRRLRPRFAPLVFLLILAISRISSAQDDAATTDAAATAAEITGTTATSDSSSTTESTSSTESTFTSSSTSTNIPVVTVPPTAGAPYMQTSSTPEGAVFIAVGAVLGFLGLAVLAWRGLVAWSVNRSVRQSAMMQSSETKGLLRSSRRKRSIVRSNQYSFPAVSGGGGAPAAGGGGGRGGGLRHHRRSGSGSHGSQRLPTIVPSSNSGLFFSPTAGARVQGPAKKDPNYYNHPSSAPYNSAGPGFGPGARAGPGPHRPNPTTSRRGGQHQYQSAGYNYGPSPPASPNLPPTGVYYGSGPLPSDNTSSSSLNLASPSRPHPQAQTQTQGTQGTQRIAPTEYLEDLFENHAPRRPPGGYNRRR